MTRVAVLAAALRECDPLAFDNMHSDWAVQSITQTLDAALAAQEGERGEAEVAVGRLFTADEVIEIANETSDSFGNLYRLDFIARIEHEAGGQS